MDKLKVFVAHSFEKQSPSHETMSDMDVANWFIQLMKKKPLGFEVTTGSKPSPERIDEKVKMDIADAGCLVGIFTKRYHDGNVNKWLPPPFILCESACAIGFYYNTSKMICGFYEDGIDPRDLALVTAGGLELVPFKRATLDLDKERFITYLRKIPSLVNLGGFQDVLYKPSYVQQALRKIYTIYRNGNITVQNITRMLITDADNYNDVEQGRIKHELWHDDQRLPAFSDLIGTPISERRDKPFLDGLFRMMNQRKIGTRLDLSPADEGDARTSFYVGFKDTDGTPVKFKNQDQLRYQYAWGLPQANVTVEEDLPKLSSGGTVMDHEYLQALVTTSHGPIHELALELRFERGKGPTFSKSPFAQYTSLLNHAPTWSLPNAMKLSDEEDHAMWFETYQLQRKDFQGAIRVLWRPAGRD